MTTSPTPTYEQLQALAASLPPLNPGLGYDQQHDWLQEPLVQAYLNHYHINFLQEGLCQQHRLGRFSAQGFDIATHILSPEHPQGTVFLVHGFTDNVGLMQHGIRLLLQEQWAVVAFDLPGHGLSSGVQASIDSFHQYRDLLQACLEQCRDTLPQPWHGIGQSTGGAIWLNYLGNNPQQTAIDKVLLLAPLIRPRGWGWARWLFPLYKMLGRDVARKFVLTSHDSEFLDFVRHQDPLQARITPLRWAVAMEEWIDNFHHFPVQHRPLTIIQGDDDLTVDADYNLEAIVEIFPDCELHLIKGGRHQLLNESETYRQPVLEHIKAWLARS